MIEKIELEVGGKTLTIETGRLAKQADGAVTVRYADTMILATACANKEPKVGWDFFPLTVDYREKTSAAGKIPGGFFKREGRPSEKEILSCRIIDRPIRPLFPDGFRCDTQVLISVLSSDQENDSDVLGLIGASAALSISDIPFAKVIAGVRVGRVGGQLVVNPTLAQLEESDMNIIMAGSADAVTMVEGGCREISEEELLTALSFGHAEINRIVEAIEKLKAKVGKPTREVKPPESNEEFESKVKNKVKSAIPGINFLLDKQERADKFTDLIDTTASELEEEYPESRDAIRGIVEEIEKADMRKRIIKDKVRMDGRGLTDIRDISCEVGILPRTHGSALFTRGQTQALVTVTLGSKADEQRIDDIMGETTKSLMLHYNFPPFSVGEVRMMRGPGRREIGHGALAERSVEKIIPTEDNFPYTIRLVSDILESNGSSSMASVCGSSLALMDAGVPIKCPIAGIAMGLIKEGDEVAVLTDILGAEDHYGDMDFKVTGTETGITAFQMDLKITGITLDIMRTALNQARDARLSIIESMNKAIDKPRAELSTYAPRIIILKVKQSKIGEIIGPGGKMIRSIIEETGAKIDIEDDGTVFIAAVGGEAGEAAKARILALIEEPEIGKEYEGTIRRIATFGAFVEILPGTDGLLHISEIDYRRIERVEDVFRLGDKVNVKVIDIDQDGKVRLSRKALLERPEGYSDEDRRPPRDGDRRPPRDDDRRPSRGPYRPRSR
ncbi:MAG: polyribonucleotide nucleotidyltransferase [candidate division Zixibacteria bacterium]|nr:polyribonucleotide nucleotidyltransferase [candidate division Zixibacteria bacterium]MBU1469718.1 polyribonucleotide nucleotidyltransferase [candidate division Zixibacteria bacterium]